jgi:hypothetical protein
MNPEEFVVNTSTDSLKLVYVKLNTISLWSENPKKHDFGSIIQSIVQNGFRDPPAWDAQLKSVVAGNGRIEALRIMEKQEYDAPRGILIHEDGGWCVPVLFGIDAASENDARRYAVDHNNLTMMGGDFTLYDIANLWEKRGYLDILNSLAESDGELPITVDYDDLRMLSASDDHNDAIQSEESSQLLATSPQSDPEDPERGIVFKFSIGASIFEKDAWSALNALVDEHPEWEAATAKKALY